MSRAYELQLEDLGIKPHLITRLKRGGIETVFDPAASSPIELMEEGGCLLTLIDALRKDISIKTRPRSVNDSL